MNYRHVSVPPSSDGEMVIDKGVGDNRVPSSEKGTENLIHTTYELRSASIDQSSIIPMKVELMESLRR